MTIQHNQAAITHLGGGNLSYLTVVSKDIATSTVKFEADDGYRLTGTLFHGNEANECVVLISSAAAVRRSYYARFAETLIRSGAAAVMTYDYRGVGDSVDCNGWSGRLNMKDWGVRDAGAALRFLDRLYPGHRIAGLGQSFGGTLLGLSREHGRFARYAMVGAGDGHLRNTNEALRLFCRMTFVGLPVAALLGRAPGWLGLGETLPASIFYDWARWCRRRNYLFDDPAVPEAQGFADVRTPILSVGITDDPWSTPRAIISLLARLPNAPRTEIWVGPRQAGGQRIGHLGFFKPAFAQTLWPPLVSWLLSGTGPNVAQPA